MTSLFNNALMLNKPLAFEALIAYNKSELNELTKPFPDSSPRTYLDAMLARFSNRKNIHIYSDIVKKYGGMHMNDLS